MKMDAQARPAFAREIGEVSMSLLVRGVVIALLIGLPALSEGIVERGGKRDFPQGTKCPVHTGEVASDDPLVFVPQTPSVILTFVACDERAAPEVDDRGNVLGYNGAGIDLSIDDLVVVDRTVFNANRLAYPDEVPDSYRMDRSTQSCYLDNPPVTSVFRREAATARTATMPLYERFDGSPRGWTLVNARFALEDKDSVNPNEPNDTSQSPSLILARRERERAPGRLCSTASVRLSRLTRGREYVIDFSWYASGFVESGQDILTVSVHGDPIPSGGVTNRSLPRPPSGLAPLPPRPRR